MSKGGEEEGETGMVEGKGIRNAYDRSRIEQEVRNKEQKEKNKKQRGEVRKSKRAARDQCEAEWKLIKEEHEKATEAWKLECERLKMDGVRPKDLPSKPKRPAKPKLVVEDKEDNSSDEEGM